MTYEVLITETLQRKVKVEAETQAQARELVMERWHNEEYVLGGDDFYDVEFETMVDNGPGADGV